ncbi:hypothetical protein GL50803_0014915 [Giardia duodenalis]|uniref:Uncharacterized protein n=1 Tax=Giardia intestinalis (strain ATCC 50803 / WB clone C6) TaxID=184922 RepID=A8BAJ7_GIAIC|nr:hypothetical protein GL50803_0014915 [Giardia intestinalis]KAE8303485.1 hypothetical protein GL50803_0014915 [Giardia intestinalis]|eukprot:XP_001708415.1 Hypothetical protein GL50803_14915 [Giardia lamblia ATCC 50803]
MALLYLFLQSLVGTLSAIGASYLLMYRRKDFQELAGKMKEDYVILDKIDSFVIITEAQRLQKEQVVKRLEVLSAKLTRMKWTSWIGTYIISAVILRLFNKLLSVKNDTLGGYLPFYFPLSVPPFSRFLQRGLPEGHDPSAVSASVIVLLLNQVLRPALLKLAKCEIPAQMAPRNAGKRMFGGTLMAPEDDAAIFT